ncbi:MAG: beta-ketoacyl-[acyl-carrier-protein] synthase family protein [Desulfotalea sp.]
MKLQRVVITGMGAVSPYGFGCEPLSDGINKGSCISKMPASDKLEDLRCHIAGLVPSMDKKTIPRQIRRTMTTMAQYAYLASLEAIEMSGMKLDELPKGRTGLALASTTSSIALIEEFFNGYAENKTLSHCNATTFFKFMGHSAASSVSQALGLSGRLIAPAAACSTSSQSIGLGAEAIALGKQEIMICGGADEVHPLTIASFDLLNAASTGYNDRPTEASRPFDRDRDGVVCSEGAGVLMLESFDHAIKRGATILAELIGFGCLSSPSNPVMSDSRSIELTMKSALDDAGLKAEEIDFINAHATSTENGDIAEAEAIAKVFGDRTPVASLKGHLGHSLAASGSLEIIACIIDQKFNSLTPTRNLQNVDDKCKNINLIKKVESIKAKYFIKNNFALGGVSTSLVIRIHR